MTPTPAVDAAATVRLVITVQALRALVYGFGAVILGSTLAAEGLSDAAAGAVFSAMLVGMALTSLAVGRFGERLGTRRLYRLLLGVMGVSGAVFAITSWLPALLLAAATGTMSTDANESGPITTLEQSLLAGAPSGVRARVFGRYNAVAYLAGSLGALLAGGPAAVRHLVPGLPAEQHWLLVFPVVAAACVVIAGRLVASPRPRLEADPAAARGLTRSRRNVHRLAGLFAVDAFAGGLVVQSFLVYWFARRYGASVELMSVVLFAAGLLQAASSVAAGRLVARIGALPVMVFTHIPSNVLLAVVPLMPTVGWAIAVLLARYALSQMDVPARQTYIAEMVDPSERTAAAAYTNTARYVGRPGGPAVAGVVMQRIWIAMPFILAGAIKVVYDLALFVLFRHVVAADEAGARLSHRDGRPRPRPGAAPSRGRG